MARWRRNPANIRLNRLIERLVADEVREAGVWRARCPAHRDRGQGLLIIAERSSMVELVCRRGCSRAAILKAMGWPADALRPQRQLVVSYTYRDAEGRELMRVERYDTPHRRRRKAYQERWAPGVDRTQPLPLYRWSELLAADPAAPVFVVEGEACVEAIRALGLVATTSARGAFGWEDRYAEQLRGRRVVILPDNDPAGEQYAARVSTALQGVAAAVTVVRLPHLPPKGAVVQYLAQGHGRAELMAYATGTEPPPVRGQSPALGPVERAVLSVLDQAGRDGLPRDQLPAHLWHWPSVSQWRRGHGDVWTYPHVDRDEYNRRQVSLTRALKSLQRKGCVVNGEGGVWRRTDAGHRALTGMSPSVRFFGGAPAGTLNGMPQRPPLFSAAAGEMLNGMPSADESFSTAPAVDEAVDPVALPSRPLDFSPPRHAPKTTYQSGRRLVIDPLEKDCTNDQIR